MAHRSCFHNATGISFSLSVLAQRIGSTCISVTFWTRPITRYASGTVLCHHILVRTGHGHGTYQYVTVHAQACPLARAQVSGLGTRWLARVWPATPSLLVRSSESRTTRDKLESPGPAAGATAARVTNFLVSPPESSFSMTEWHWLAMPHPPTGTVTWLPTSENWRK